MYLIGVINENIVGQKLSTNLTLFFHYFQDKDVHYKYIKKPID